MDCRNEDEISLFYLILKTSGFSESDFGWKISRAENNLDKYLELVKRKGMSL